MRKYLSEFLILCLVGVILVGMVGLMNRSAIAGQVQARGDESTYDSVITHGPILGRLSHEGVGVWIRTSRPSKFVVFCRLDHTAVARSPRGETKLENDNTGWVHITGLKPNTTYRYEIELTSGYWMHGGTFTTLPLADSEKHPHNPDGLFNFSFEFGCGNNPTRGGTHGPTMPGFKTMYDTCKGKIHFQIMNGDWLYEEQRVTPVEKWQRLTGVADEDIPRIVDIAPSIVGVWANYKLYLSRQENLAKWHRNIPTFFVYDDHEMINDINGTNNPGFRDRKTVFRDIGIQAWYDYIGWSNPLSDPEPQPIKFGKADVTEGNDILFDMEADFTKLDLEKASNLMILWGAEDAGVWDNRLDDTVGGHPASACYGIKEVIDKNRLRIYPPAKADGDQISYSIGMRSYYDLKVSNCHFFIIDCRGHRMFHDNTDPWKKGISMIGQEQKIWLKEAMAKSDADFLFLVSSVNFTIPHVGPGPPGKDEAWTAYMDEREELISFWDKLNKPVLVLTGDLHNSFVIKITDRVWEFASGPHNSGNHSLSNEANRPPSGDYEYNGRKVNIRWSTFFLDDVIRRPFPYFCVVKVNNVFNNPTEIRETRWVAYPQPQVILQYFDGITGELLYAEAIGAVK